MSHFFQAYCRAGELKRAILDQRDLESQIDHPVQAKIGRTT